MWKDSCNQQEAEEAPCLLARAFCNFLALNSKHQIYLRIYGLSCRLAAARKLKRMMFFIISMGLICFAGCNECEKNI